MAMTITPDQDSAGCVGLWAQTHRGIRKCDCTVNLGNPYTVGGELLSAAVLKAALDTAFGCSTPTLVVDSVDFHGDSIDGSTRMGWIAATGRVMGYNLGVAMTQTPGTGTACAWNAAPTACSMVGGTALVVAGSQYDSAINPASGIGALPATTRLVNKLTGWTGAAYADLVILPAGTVPAAGQAAIDLATMSIQTFVADALTHVYCELIEVTDGADAVFTPDAPGTFTPDIPIAITTNVVAAEYGAVDLSGAGLTCRATIHFHEA